MCVFGDGDKPTALRRYPTTPIMETLANWCVSATQLTNTASAPRRLLVAALASVETPLGVSSQRGIVLVPEPSQDVQTGRDTRTPDVMFRTGNLGSYPFGWLLATVCVRNCFVS